MPILWQLKKLMLDIIMIVCAMINFICALCSIIIIIIGYVHYP